MNSREIAKEIRLDNNTYPWSDKVQKLAKDYLDLLVKMEGHVLVPVEPNYNQLIAGYVNFDLKNPSNSVCQIYKAMIGATNDN